MATDKFEFGRKSENVNAGLNPIQKEDLVNAIKQIFWENPTILQDIRWSKHFDFITFFESLDGFDVNDGTGTVVAGPTQITFTTTDVDDEFAELTKKPQQQGFMTFSQLSRFRTTISMGSVADVSVWILHGSIGNQSYGFKVVDNAIYGFTRDIGGTEATVLLQTISASTNYNLEARYQPNQKIIFLVNAIEKGTFITNLPTATTDALNSNLMDIKLQTNTTAVKTMVMSFFQYQSSRNVLNF